ncbi:ENTH-domain-containing protein [Lepidopterella palustris CBS 459.81]|uniref:ENTH-domain-containing protein n=1 Tax=Lepidopterella palustris CBS 459.81 TaxID=1314670 RepID=A0A8E2EHL2_9PEZI|nr:ENTH-domain-containing protein [Lepidopterella palustris CBS 459.81]
MDFSSLKEQVSNLTLYDLKAGVRKVQNAVMNYTEMEAKVREATNNEPWGASSSIMQEIANGTFNYQLLNEIMPMIYKRFTEKSAEEWRQIYKALQLLEFLIKNGSERVIDDARSHISLLKMLRQFHFIDQNGKDQGINVRNRSKELAELLSDVDRIRAERKKARATRNKYGGVEGGMGFGMGGSMSGNGSRFGGFGSEEADGGYGSYSGGVYGDGGGFGGAESGGFSDTQGRRDRFEEYDEYDEGAVAAPGRRKADAPSTTTTVQRETKKSEPPKPKEPEVDLFSFGDEDTTTSTSNGKQKAAVTPLDDFGADDDDFDDFQAAPPAPSATVHQPSSASIAPPASTSTTTSKTQFAAPQPRSGTQGASINDLFASISPAPSNKTASPALSSAFSPPPMPQQSQPFQSTGFQANQPNYFTSVPVTTQPSISSSSSTSGVLSSSVNKPVAPKASSGGDAFSSLLSGTTLKKASTPTQKVTMADMAKQKASAGIWGAPTSYTPSIQPGAAPKTSSAFDDLLG